MFVLGLTHSLQEIRCLRLLPYVAMTVITLSVRKSCVYLFISKKKLSTISVPCSLLDKNIRLLFCFILVILVPRLSLGTRIWRRSLLVIAAGTSYEMNIKSKKCNAARAHSRAPLQISNYALNYFLKIPKLTW